MSDIKLFRLTSGKAHELQGDASDLERPLQTLIENNLEALLGIRFIASEYSTGKTHAGRIDSLGIDENDCPVILEYKRSVGEDVINQGLFYLDWLMDHQAEFKLLVMDRLGRDAAYRLFGEELLLLEQANAAPTPSRGAAPRSVVSMTKQPARNSTGDKSFAEWLEVISDPLRELLASLEDYITSLGDDVQRKELKLYVAFKRLKNFAIVVLQRNKMVLCLHLNPDTVQPLPSTARDVRYCGHWGTGDLEIAISSPEDLEVAKPLIREAYEGRGLVVASSAVVQ